ncbi:MAG: PilN domain-containing protein [Candidatus Aminicenantes bacterium]|jgi:Tfp pilus assembly protein PilN|nr:PilN domain-containing protein [Candidatus Aminicenantes bacterium]
MIRINLLKEEPKVPTGPKEEKAVKERKPFPMTSLLGLFFVIAVAVGFLQFNALKKEKNLMNVEQEKKNKLRDVTSKLQTVRDQQDLIVRKINLINLLKSQQGVAVNIMDELSRHIPYWVWLTEVNFSRQQVQIRGRAVDNNLIADYIESLETSPYFQNVNLQSSHRRQGRGNEYLDFALTATYIFPQISQPLIKAQEKGN